MSSTNPTSPSASPSPAATPGRSLSFRARLIIGVCGLVLLTGGTIAWLAFRTARETTQVLAESLFREVSQHAVTQTRDFVLRAGPLVESLRGLASRGLALDDQQRLAGQLLAVLEANPGLSWISYGDEAGTFTGAYRAADGELRINRSRIENGHTHLIEERVEKDGTWTAFHRDDDSGYDPRQRPFYKKARETGRVTWLPPYVFYNQGIPGISCAAPIYADRSAKPAAASDAQKLRGVLSIDFDLNALSSFVSRLSVSEHSEVFVFTNDEVLLAHPQSMRLDAGRDNARGAGRLLSLSDTQDPVVEAYREHFRGAGKRNGSPDAFRMFEFRHEGTKYLGSATTFPVGGDLTWVVGAVAPRSDFLGGVQRSQEIALAVACLAMGVAVLLAGFFAGRVSGPVQGLIGFMRRVGAGDLDARANFGGSLEFQQLSTALNHMIAEVREGLRLRHALDLAMEVQQRLLPQEPPQVRGLDVAGHSTYCDETGGDYYDFLVLDQTSPDQLIVALGDVMGHGVAAALVMAGTRAVLRDRAGGDPGNGNGMPAAPEDLPSLPQLVGRINRLIAADHEGTRFMTMHLALIDSRARSYRWVSAGHDPALIYDPSTKTFLELDAGDLPLGIVDDHEFSEHHQHSPLRPGQIYLIGTDGVWEMPDSTGEQFGKDRLREIVRDHASDSAEQISQAIRTRLTTFRGAMKAVDDVTFVVIKVV